MSQPPRRRSSPPSPRRSWPAGRGLARAARRWARSRRRRTRSRMRRTRRSRCPRSSRAPGGPGRGAGDARRRSRRIEDQVPPTVDLPALFRLLQAAADRAAVDFFSFTPGTPAPDRDRGLLEAPVHRHRDGRLLRDRRDSCSCSRRCRARRRSRSITVSPSSVAVAEGGDPTATTSTLQLAARPWSSTRPTPARAPGRTRAPPRPGPRSLIMRTHPPTDKRLLQIRSGAVVPVLILLYLFVLEGVARRRSPAGAPDRESSGPDGGPHRHAVPDAPRDLPPVVLAGERDPFSIPASAPVRERQRHHAVAPTGSVRPDLQR